MKTPFLTTTFSENAEQAKSRFANILDTKAKKLGAFALAAVILLVVICGIVVTSVQKNSGDIVPGDTVVLTRDAEIADEVTAYKGDLLYVIYEEADTYHVQMPYMSYPATYGYVEKSAVSKDAEKLGKANYVALKPGTVYHYEDRTPMPIENRDGVAIDGPMRGPGYYTQVLVTRREGEWCEVSLTGGLDNIWVKSADMEPIVLPNNVDLDYLDLQRRVDAGEEQWRLSAGKVINDYLRNTKKAPQEKLVDEEKLGRTQHVAPFLSTNIEEDYSVTVYQPIKKGEGGIWVVNDATLMRGQMDAAVPEDVQVIVNSGMGWRINLTENKMIYTPYSSKQSWTVEDLAAQMGFDAKDYYGKDIDVMIYEYTAPKGETAYMFLFDDAQLIAHYELDTKDKLELAKQTFIKWTEK